MDPITIVGLISGAVQIASAISETLSGLASLKGKFQNADLTIASLEGQLKTIQAAVTQLENSRKTTSVPSSSEYNENLDVALDGCRTIMAALSEEVLHLTQSQMGMRDRMRVVWREDVMRGHQDRLQSQVVALQLLIQAGHYQTFSEQNELLRRAENRYIFRKVADDALTIRSSSRYAASRASTSSLSQRASTPGHTHFDFDREMLSTIAYQSLLQQPYLGARTWSSASTSTQSQMTDEGYISGATTNTTVSRNTSLVLPPHPSGSISPTLEHSNSVAFRRPPISNAAQAQRSKSDSTFPPQVTRTSKSRREKIYSLARRFSTPLLRPPTSPQGPASNPSETSLRLERPRYDRNTHTSIDITSPEGVSAPPIVKIAQSGSFSDVERLIESGCDVEAKHFQSGRTALLVASHCGNEAVVGLLIQRNAHVDAVDGSGSTALHLAASRGHCGVLRLLLQEVSNIEAQDSRGRTALWVAAENGQEQATQLLLSVKARVNARARSSQMTPLHAACKRGDDAIVKLLIRGGADLEAKDGTMMTALHYACENGHEKVIQVLLENKAKIDATGFDRRTPLICAAAVGGVEATNILLNRKASWRLSDDGGMMALHWAAYNGHEEVVNLLSSRKGALEMSNVAGRTALHLAAMNSQFAVVESLVRKNMPLDVRCASGLTALHYACLADNIAISRLLLIEGADIEAQMAGELQRRPIHIAAAQGSMGLLGLLCDKNASLDARDALGYRALGIACRFGHSAAVQKLLDKGAPVHSMSETRGREDSPLCLAAMEGHLPVVMLLLERGASVLKQDEHNWWPYQYAAHYGHPQVLEILLARSLSEVITNRNNVRLTFEGIGFAPSAKISENCRKMVLDLLNQAQQQPESLIRGITSPRPLIEETPRMPTVAISQRVPQFSLISSLSPVPEMLPRSGAQELPGTLEQGLPSSRSQTPEQLNRPQNSEESDIGPRLQTLLSLHGREPPPISGHGMFTSVHTPEPQRQSPRILNMNHPTPRRGGRLLSTAISSQMNEILEERLTDSSPVSLPTTSSDRDLSVRIENRDYWNRARLREEYPYPDPASDTDSVSTVYTAPEGVSELPA